MAAWQHFHYFLPTHCPLLPLTSQPRPHSEVQSSCPVTSHCDDHGALMRKTSPQWQRDGDNQNFSFWCVKIWQTPGETACVWGWTPFFLLSGLSLLNLRAVFCPCQLFLRNASHVMRFRMELFSGRSHPPPKKMFLTEYNSSQSGQMPTVQIHIFIPEMTGCGTQCHGLVTWRWSVTGCAGWTEGSFPTNRFCWFSDSTLQAAPVSAGLGGVGATPRRLPQARRSNSAGRRERRGPRHLEPRSLVVQPR